MLVHNREVAILHTANPNANRGTQQGITTLKRQQNYPTSATNVVIKRQIKFGIARMGLEPATLLLWGEHSTREPKTRPILKITW